MISSKQLDTRKYLPACLPTKVTKLGDVSPVRLFFVGSLIKYPKNGSTLGFNFFLHFHLHKLFENVFCILAAVLADLKKLGDFFPYHLVTLLPTSPPCLHQEPML
jgi:hypothetical protein